MVLFLRFVPTDSRKSISSSPSLSIKDGSIITVTNNTAPVATTSTVVAQPSPPSPVTVYEPERWQSELTQLVDVWEKQVGQVPISQQSHVTEITDDDVDMDMGMDVDLERLEVSSVASAPASIVTASEQQEWIKTIDAQIEQNQRQLEITTVEISRVEEVIKPAKRYIPTKITTYFPSAPYLSIPALHLSSPVEIKEVVIVESEEDRKQREVLEELAKSLSSVSLRKRTRPTPVASKPVGKTAKASKPPPPIGIGMMMGYKTAKHESPSPRSKGKETESHTKITKRGVISGSRGGVPKTRGSPMRRRNSAGRGDTIAL